MSFNKEQIMRMYPNTQYYVKNSNGGLFAGTMELEKAKEYAEEYKKECLEDPWGNDKMEVFVVNREGEKVYIAKGNVKKYRKEENEEFE